MVNQKERILKYIADFGSITNLDAVRDLGIGHLASRITDLRRDGYPIISDMETGKNRYGEKTSYCRYRLEASE